MPEVKACWKDEIKKLTQCIQRQDSTLDQLRDLHYIANLLGFYDAADFLKERIYKCKY
jgi:hypothetical protein